jgi:hypothetical protein
MPHRPSLFINARGGIWCRRVVVRHIYQCILASNLDLCSFVLPSKLWSPPVFMVLLETRASLPSWPSDFSVVTSHATVELLTHVRRNKNAEAVVIFLKKSSSCAQHITLRPTTQTRARVSMTWRISHTRDDLWMVDNTCGPMKNDDVFDAVARSVHFHVVAGLGIILYFIMKVYQDSARTEAYSQ